MSETQRTLFVQYDHQDWTTEGLQGAVDSMQAVTPDDTNVMLVDTGFEFMDESQVEQLANQLLESIE